MIQRFLRQFHQRPFLRLNREECFTSSSSLPPRNYDVFLSFRGQDTRKNFTDHLFAALVRQGFFTFRDDKLKRGEKIQFELLKAIEGSRISVIIFSRNYAASRWCLDELVKILECKLTLQQMVLPIFYHVHPSDIWAQKGCFAKAFAKHEERYKGRGMEGKIEKWRAALTEASKLSGWDLHDVANRHESKFIEMIVKDISEKLNLPNLNVANYPVGMDSRVQHVNMLLNLGSDDVRMVGILGNGGIGKTTIAKAVYNQIHLAFEGSSFLANIREISKQPNGLVGLQGQLFADIQMNEDRNIRNVDQGIELIKQRLWCRRVFIVLDDVDEFYQLKALAIRRDWFHLGSRIIVTTRYKSLLKLLEVDNVYVPELLTAEESLELFSWHAFRRKHPLEDYEELSKEVVYYAGGCPSDLEMLGSILVGTSVPEWKKVLKRLKEKPHDTIQKLRIRFASLNEEEKDLAMDKEPWKWSANHTVREAVETSLESKVVAIDRRSGCLKPVWGERKEAKNPEGEEVDKMHTFKMTHTHHDASIEDYASKRKRQIQLLESLIQILERMESSTAQDEALTQIMETFGFGVQPSQLHSDNARFSELIQLLESLIQILERMESTSSTAQDEALLTQIMETFGFGVHPSQLHSDNARFSEVLGMAEARCLERIATQKALASMAQHLLTVTQQQLEQQKQMGKINDTLGIFVNHFGIMTPIDPEATKPPDDELPYNEPSHEFTLSRLK